MHMIHLEGTLKVDEVRCGPYKQTGYHGDPVEFGGAARRPRCVHGAL